MKKSRTIITIIAFSLFLSSMQSCYVEQDTGRHRWWYHRHERDRDFDHHHDHDRGGVILITPEHHDRDDDHDYHD